MRHATYRSREVVRALRKALRRHDPDAAEQLLSHSVALGHERLGLRRYLAARYLGASDLQQYKSFFLSSAREFSPGDLLTAAQTVAKELHVERLVTDKFRDFCAAYNLPSFSSGEHNSLLSSNVGYRSSDACLIGDVRLGLSPWLAPFSTIRGDDTSIQVGDDFRVGEHSTVLSSGGQQCATIGDRVTVGTNVILRGSTVGAGCVVGDGTIVLDGAIVDDNVLIEPNSLVGPHSHLISGLVYAGSPARAVRSIGRPELEARRLLLSNSIFASLFDEQLTMHPNKANAPPSTFIATTARVAGRVTIGTNSTIFPGCMLHSTDGDISIGENCIILDNAVLDAGDVSISIGDNCLIEQNAHLKCCQIGTHTLIGIGSSVSDGTIIGNDVVLTPGSTTMVGQHLESNWIWGGRPARPISKTGDASREEISRALQEHRSDAMQYTHGKSSKGGPEWDTDFPGSSPRPEIVGKPALVQALE